MKRNSKLVVTLFFGLLLSGCESAYYGAWEQVGVHKRDILVDRIEDTQQAQEETQEQFKDALEQYRAVVNFDGGELEKYYDRLNSEYEASERAAQQIKDRIDAVENVAADLFEEWQNELDLYTDQRLRRNSSKQLRDTRYRYKLMMQAMRKAEKTVHPVLNALRDQVLYLKHNLNARAIASLKGELSAIDADVARLIGEMQRSIDESSRFIESMR